MFFTIGVTVCVGVATGWDVGVKVAVGATAVIVGNTVAVGVIWETAVGVADSDWPQPISSSKNRKVAQLLKTFIQSP